ncbi:hypothetical protein KR018_005374, partial [Drosophila ironensis]
SKSVSIEMNPAEEKVKLKAKRSRKRRLRRSRRVAYLASVVLFALALSPLIRPTSTQDKKSLEYKAIQVGSSIRVVRGTDPYTGQPFRPGYVGHGTTHEQRGQPHWPPAEFSDYEGWWIDYSYYAASSMSSTSSIEPLYESLHFFHEYLFSATDPLPEGYIVRNNSDTVDLGPNVTSNEWSYLLHNFWVFLIVIIILLFLIIIMPFLGVIYCCLCGCRRCPRGCPPCTIVEDFFKRIFCGILLLLLILGLIFGLLMAIMSNSLFESSFQGSSQMMMLIGEGTCEFLREVLHHVYHLLINNFEELEYHVMYHLNFSDRHIFLDFIDVSRIHTMSELHNTFENMPRAYDLMKDVQKWFTELNFMGAQLRDQLRGIKRDIVFASSKMCVQNTVCDRFFVDTEVMKYGYSDCLHFDSMPDPAVYVQAMEKIIKDKPHSSIKDGIKRLVNLGNRIREEMVIYKAQMIKDFDKGKSIIMEKAEFLTQELERVISRINKKFTRTAESFDDVYHRFGPDRNVISLIACLLIFLVIVLLIIALCCGCLGKRRDGFEDKCCSKNTAACALVCAIILIFCIISFIILVGLTYLVVGFLTYSGACAPLRDREEDEIWRHLDNTIRLNDYSFEMMPTLRMSKDIETCEADDTIFQLMRDNSIYNANDLSNITFLTESNTPFFNDDLSAYETLTSSEEEKFMEASKGKLGDYHSSKFNQLCTKYTHLSLPEFSDKMDSFAQPFSYNMAKTTLGTVANNARNLHDTFVRDMRTLAIKIRINLMKIDKLITLDKYDFGTSVQKMVTVTKETQQFIQTRGNEFINVIHYNISESIKADYKRYLKNAVKNMLNEVGKCAPLAYLFVSTMHHLCGHISDPINGLAAGLLLCALLFLPILFVAQKLMCLYKKIYP